MKDEFRKDINLEDKQNDLNYKDPVDDYQWKNYLDEKAIAHFKNTFDFNSEEGIIYWKLLELTEPENRLDHPFFKTPGNWDFESMLDAIFNGYYVLIDLVKEKRDRGCLYYQPTAYPFGGSDSLVELIKSFGNRITYNSRSKHSKPVIESQWDYELAKELVRQGIGFTPELLHNWKI
ncbi:hypothetical protein I4641_17715 [Waterburya agarophytonicola K14]|uniref:Uncharacterized protein n=1 Tax=Waterburya agarophytonicola KI4 TaxID=2874699 RepID=A0A964FGF1_9CYAN|nr:hypothetical protein [Waterburya agarophytonicola]MCC0178810.1 hypothetical protein [Waterburya agarophytonicola KI4]